MKALHLFAPHLTDMDVLCDDRWSMSHTNVPTKVLLGSCSTTLVHLSCQVNSHAQAMHLVSMLPNLHHCESLRLKFGAFSIHPRFWYSLEPECLPKVQVLQVISDHLLNERDIIRFLQRRKTSKLPPLEEVELLNCPRVDPGCAIQLHELVPKFITRSVGPSRGEIDGYDSSLDDDLYEDDEHLVDSVSVSSSEDDEFSSDNLSGSSLIDTDDDGFSDALLPESYF
jgi:hypothetical protein